MPRIYEYECIDHGGFEVLFMKQDDYELNQDFTKCKTCGKLSNRVLTTSHLAESFIMAGSNRRGYKYSDPRKKGLSTS